MGIAIRGAVIRLLRRWFRQHGAGSGGSRVLLAQATPEWRNAVRSAIRVASRYSSSSSSGGSGVGGSGVSVGVGRQQQQHQRQHQQLHQRQQQQERNFSLRLGQAAATTPMCSSRSYEDAVAQLNRLQSNSAAIEDSLKTRQVSAPLMYTRSTSYLHELGIEQKHLTALRVIHLAGTKGKGSTCAFTESILRAYGYKTGFYSSPHLVAVRERIRINGAPISKELFAKHFWDTYDTLSDFERRSGERVPMYFAFLTMMAFRVFVHEKVHVAVMEVGIGGEYDWTNVIDQPSVVGITSLGLDHTRLLGNTIEQIAWHKAGIMKFLVPAFTASQHPDAMKVLQNKAVERRCHLYTVPSLQLYDTAGHHVQLGIPGKVQLENASLALQLAHFWIKKNDPFRFPEVDWGVSIRDDMHTFAYGQSTMTLARPFALPLESVQGLEACRWPGRCQRLTRGGVTYFLDGAHTLESMEECVRWFGQCHQSSAGSSRRLRVLVFACTGDRDPKPLLACLHRLGFDVVIFTPTRTFVQSALSSDNSNFTVDLNKDRDRVATIEQTFMQLCGSGGGSNSNNSSSSDHHHHHKIETHAFDCVADALKKVKHIADEQQLEHRKISVLITGSLHLVGNAMTILDPDLECL